MPEHQSDHDILVEVKTIQQIMVQDIKEIKDGTSRRLADLEAGKANKSDLKDLIRIVDGLKTYQNRAIGAIVIIQIILGVLVTYYFSKH